MKIVVDAANVVQALGETDFVAPDGGAVLDTALTLADYAAADEAGQALGGPYQIVYDRTADTLSAQTRPLTAREADDNNRRAIFKTINSAIDGWSGATAAQKDTAMLTALKAIKEIGLYLARQGA